MVSTDGEIRALVASRLRALRRGAGMKQYEAGAALGVSQCALSAYEHGRHEPGIATLARAARLYGVTLTAIVSEEDC